MNYGKPNPEMFNKTISYFKVNKANCLVFEDSIEGITAANNAGIKVIGVTSSNSSDVLRKAGCVETINNYLNYHL